MENNVCLIQRYASKDHNNCNQGQIHDLGIGVAGAAAGQDRGTERDENLPRTTHVKIKTI
jgi:hypothetical protein